MCIRGAQLQAQNAVLMIALVCVVPNNALGVDRAKARAAQQKAFEAAATGDKAAAIVAFEEAYKFDPRPNYLFNQAVLYQEWGVQHCERALKAFERFFEHCKACQERTVAKKRLKQLTENCQSRVTIESQPPDAQVFLDGQKLGPTPRSTFIFPGQHRISLRLSGHLEKTETIEVRPRTPVVLKWSLEPQIGTLQIVGLSKDAEVYVDDKRAVVESGRVRLAVGLRQIRLQLPGRAPVNRRMEIAAEQVATLEVPAPKLRQAPSVHVSQRTTSALSIGAYSTAGLAAVGVAIGIGASVLKGRTLKDQDAAYMRLTAGEDTSTVLQLRQRASREYWFQATSFSIAGAFAAVSITLFLLDVFGDAQTKEKPIVSPTISVGQFGVTHVREF